MNVTYIQPQEIEHRSMEIIERELGETQWEAEELMVVKRCIHTSADFDYAKNLIFSDQAVKKGIAALKSGTSIVTDTNMAAAGINKKVLSKLGGSVYCFMGDEDVAQEAKDRGVTRAAICMDRAAALENSLIFAIGNAPTALMRLYELIKEGRIAPKLVIGVPVGFVNVVESKEQISGLNVPYIIAEGRKGGSNIAAAICNALLYQSSDYR